jgi:hypothetical protein
MAIGASSAPYAKFTSPGDRHGGEIVDFRIVQNSDPKVRRPLYLAPTADGKWERSFAAYGPDNKPNDPICQWEITVETGVEDDNGDTERRVFVDPRKGRRGTTTEGKRGGDAIAIALKKAKAGRVGLEIGAKLFVTYLGKVQDGDNQVNTWSAEYEPPVGGPGAGKPVDEVPWLAGGERYHKQAELARWEAARNGGTAAAAAFTPPVPGPAPTSPAAQASAQQGIRDTTVAPSTVPATTFDDDEIPF